MCDGCYLLRSVPSLRRWWASCGCICMLIAALFSQFHITPNRKCLSRCTLHLAYCVLEFMNSMAKSNQLFYIVAIKKVIEFQRFLSLKINYWTDRMRHTPNTDAFSLRCSHASLKLTFHLYLKFICRFLWLSRSLRCIQEVEMLHLLFAMANEQKINL